MFALKARLENLSIFWFSLFEFVALATPDNTDVYYSTAHFLPDPPTSKKYVTAQQSLLNALKLKYSTIFAREKH